MTKNIKLEDVEEMIKKNDFTVYTETESEENSYKAIRSDLLINYLSSLPTQNVPEIDNFYEFSE